MISCDEIKNISFRKSLFGGYKPQEVDAFLDDIQTSYEEILRENRNLSLNVQKLEKQLQKFYDEESSIKNVLLNLKKATDQALYDAGEKAKGLIAESMKKSDEMISKAKKEVLYHQSISDNLKKESERLKKSLENIYLQHLEIMKKFPRVGTLRNENESSES